MSARKIYRQIQIYNKGTGNFEIIHYLINANSRHHLDYIKKLRRQEINKGLDWRTSFFFRFKLDIVYGTPIIERPLSLNKYRTELPF